MTQQKFPKVTGYNPTTGRQIPGPDWENITGKRFQSFYVRLLRCLPPPPRGAPVAASIRFSWKFFGKSPV